VLVLELDELGPDVDVILALGLVLPRDLFVLVLQLELPLLYHLVLQALGFELLQLVNGLFVLRLLDLDLRLEERELVLELALLVVLELVLGLQLDVVLLLCRELLRQLGYPSFLLLHDVVPSVKIN